MYPWNEDKSVLDVVHLPERPELVRTLRRPLHVVADFDSRKSLSTSISDSSPRRYLFSHIIVTLEVCKGEVVLIDPKKGSVRIAR